MYKILIADDEKKLRETLRDYLEAGGIQMKLVVIVGPHAVGKMTVGQELSKITGLKLFHNHMTIEPVIEIFGKYDGNVIKQFWEVIFNNYFQKISNPKKQQLLIKI